MCVAVKKHIRLAKLTCKLIHLKLDIAVFAFYQRDFLDAVDDIARHQCTEQYDWRDKQNDSIAKFHVVIILIFHCFSSN